MPIIELSCVNILLLVTDHSSRVINLKKEAMKSIQVELHNGTAMSN